MPGDHISAEVNRVLDLFWLRGEVADLYCEDNGRLAIDPEGYAFDASWVSSWRRA